MNGSFCPHSHERTCHLSVSANWLFTTFQHRQSDTFLNVLSLSFSLTPQYKFLAKRVFLFFLNIYIYVFIWLKLIAHSCILVHLKKPSGTGFICRSKSMWTKIPGIQGDVFKERLESFRYWKEYKVKDRKRFSFFFFFFPTWTSKTSFPLCKPADLLQPLTWKDKY